MSSRNFHDLDKPVKRDRGGKEEEREEKEEEEEERVYSQVGPGRWRNPVRSCFGLFSAGLSLPVFPHTTRRYLFAFTFARDLLVRRPLDVRTISFLGPNDTFFHTTAAPQSLFGFDLLFLIRSIIWIESIETERYLMPGSHKEMGRPHQFEADRLEICVWRLSWGHRRRGWSLEWSSVNSKHNKFSFSRMHYCGKSVASCLSKESKNWKVFRSTK